MIIRARYGQAGYKAEELSAGAAEDQSPTKLAWSILTPESSGPPHLTQALINRTGPFYTYGEFVSLAS